MAISKKLVEMMGGEVRVESKKGRGSVFFLHPRISRSRKRAEGEERAFAGKHALIVDDNASSRNILEQHARRWKLETAVANDARAALATLREGVVKNAPYQVAIVDLEMPDMDGLSLAREIKNDPALAGTRVVLLAPLGQKVEAEKLAESGVTAWLNKPVKQLRLGQAMTDALGGGAAKAKTGKTAIPAEAAAKPKRHADAHPGGGRQHDQPKGARGAAAKAGATRPM